MIKKSSFRFHRTTLINENKVRIDVALCYGATNCVPNSATEADLHAVEEEMASLAMDSLYGEAVEALAKVQATVYQMAIEANASSGSLKEVEAAIDALRLLLQG